MNKLIAKGMDYILIPIEEPDTTKGGIYVSPAYRKRINNGVVISKGSLTKEDIEPGDHVLFNGRSGDQVTLRESGRFFVIPESHIIAKLENSTVRVVDLETVKRLIRERINELKTNYRRSAVHRYDNTEWEDIKESLIDRLNSLTISEGMEF